MSSPIHSHTDAPAGLCEGYGVLKLKTPLKIELGDVAILFRRTALSKLPSKAPFQENPVLVGRTSSGRRVPPRLHLP